MPLDVVVLMDAMGRSSSPRTRLSRCCSKRSAAAIACTTSARAAWARDGEAGAARAAAGARRQRGLVQLGEPAQRPLSGRCGADAQGSAVRRRFPLRHPGPRACAQRAGALVVNDPQGLRDANEKLFAAAVPAVLPADRWWRATRPRCKAFVAEHGEAVLKPLDGMGGRSIFRAARGDPNLNVILETLTATAATSRWRSATCRRSRRRQAHPADRRRAGALLPGAGPAGRRLPRQPRRAAAAARAAR